MESFETFKELLDRHDNAREAARVYEQEKGLASSAEELAGDLAVIIEGLLEGRVPVPAEAAIPRLAEYEQSGDYHPDDPKYDEISRRALAVRELEKLYLEEHAEDSRDGTDFDCTVLDALDKIRDKFGLPKSPDS